MPSEDDNVIGGGAPSPPSAEPQPEAEGSPVPTVARAHSGTSFTNRHTPGRMVGTPGVAARRKLAAEREMLRYRLRRVKPQLDPLRRGQPESDPDVGAAEVVSASGPERKKWNPWPVVASVAGMIAVAALCALFWPMVRKVMGNATPGTAAAVSRLPSPRRLEMREAVGRAGRELPADPSAALTTALDHLSSALEGAPADALREVSKPGQKCTMVWANDSPSLVFGGEPKRPNSLAHQLEECAEAVSRVPR